MDKSISFLVNFLSVLVIINSVLQNQNNVKEQKFKNVIVYRIKPQHNHGRVNVTALAILNNNIYYLKRGDNRTINGLFPYHNARIINNPKLRQLLNSIDLNSLRHIAGENCDCKGYTENRFIVRDLSKKSVDEIAFNEILLCDKTSKCNIIQILRNEFEVLNNLR